MRVTRRHNFLFFFLCVCCSPLWLGVQLFGLLKAKFGGDSPRVMRLEGMFEEAVSQLADEDHNELLMNARAINDELIRKHPTNSVRTLFVLHFLVLLF